MNAIIRCIFFIELACLLATPFAKLSAQSLHGKITDENSTPIPYASVFVKEAKQGTTSNTDGAYFINLPKGTYSITFRCLGFETLEKTVDVSNEKVTLNIVLPVKPYQIAPVTVGSKGEDPAYSIVRKAIGMAPYYQSQIKEFDAEVYLKGTLKIKKLSWVVKKAIGKDADAPKEGLLYIQESVNSIHFTAPDRYDQKVKMIRSNFPSDNSGTNDIMRFANASFYQPQIGDIILPLAPYALNHYNFKYDGFSIQGSRVINRIKVIPKRKSKQLVSGYIYIADDLWNLHEVDLTNESVFGTIRIKQTFGEIEANAWLPVSHHYEINGDFMGNKGDALYISSVKYSNIKVNNALKTPSNIAQRQRQEKVEVQKPAAAKKKNSHKQQTKEKKNAEKLDQLMSKEVLSNKEMYELAKLMNKQVKKTDTLAKSLEVIDPIAVTVDSAARKVDSTKWRAVRPVVLTADEINADKNINKKLQQQADSTKNDSIQQKNSSLLNAVAFGKTWRNPEKKQTINFAGLLSLNGFKFNTVDGFVMGTTFSYKKSFRDKGIQIKPSFSYAFSRKRPMGTFAGSFSYSGKYRGIAGLNFGLTSTDFNQAEGISNIENTIASLGFGRNYMKLFEDRYISMFNRIDPLNGLEIYTAVTFSNREMLSNTTDITIFNKYRDWYTPNIPLNALIGNNNYGDNKALIGNVGISYTPFYHYRMQGNRKVMLYSNYPTIRVNAKFGIPDALNSGADFVSIEASIFQSMSFGPGNRFWYSLVYGNFISKRKLYFNDFAHFNTQIIPVTVKQFGNNYQNLNYYRWSTNTEYGQAFFNYQTPYLALKYLPFLSNRMWLENLHLSSLISKEHKPYYEFGYSMSQIGALASVGFFAGFEGLKFDTFNVKVSIILPGFDM